MHVSDSLPRGASTSATRNEKRKLVDFAIFPIQFLGLCFALAMFDGGDARRVSERAVRGRERAEKAYDHDRTHSQRPEFSETCNI